MDRHKVTIPEPASNIESEGVLSVLWRKGDTLPKLEGFELLLSYLKQGISSAIALPMSCFITVVTIAISLFLLSGFLYVLQNVDQVLDDAGSTLYITAYIKEGVSDSATERLIESLRNDETVQEVIFVSKDQALANFRKELGNRSGFLVGLETENPLPASLEIMLRPQVRSINSAEKTVNYLRETNLIEEVLYGSEWVERMQGIVKVFRLFGIVALLIVLVVIMFLIANTIKLVIFARKDEISIMQLVGAPDRFVKIPFILGGMLQGGAGALFSLFFLFAVSSVVNHEIKDIALFGVQVPELMFLSATATIGVVLVGVVVGAMGSFFALGKFMNV